MAIHQYQVRQTFLNQKMMNVFYYDHVQEDDAYKQEITDALRAAWVTQLALSTLHTSWSLDEVVVRNVSLAGTLSQSFVPTLGAAVGTSATDPLPSQIALLVVTKGQSVKPNRTRTYLTGFVEGATTGGFFTSSFLTAARNWGLAVANLVTATKGTFTRRSVEWVGVPPVVADDNPVGTVIAFNVPATQRRRRIGVGA